MTLKVKTEDILVNKAQLLKLTISELVVLVGGLRVLERFTSTTTLEC